MEVIIKAKKNLIDYQNEELIIKKAIIKDSLTGSEIIFTSAEALNFEFTEEAIIIEEQGERKIINYSLKVDKVEVFIKEDIETIEFLILTEQIFL